MDARNNAVGGGLHIGAFGTIFNSGPTVSGRSFNDAAFYINFLFQSETSNPITKLGILLAALVGTSPSYIISLQGIDTSSSNGAKADGITKGGGSPAAKIFNPSSLGWPASSLSFHWLTLDNPYTPSRGEFLSIAIEYRSGTIDGSNFAVFGCDVSGASWAGFPCEIFPTAGLPGRPAAQPIFGYATDTQKYGSPIQSFSNQVFNSGTSGADEYGLKFSLPADWGATYQLRGVRFLGGASDGNVSTKIILYGGTDNTPDNSTGAVTESTVIQDVSVHHRVIGSALGGQLTQEILFDESSLATLYYGATYRLAFQPQSTTGFQIGKTVFASNDDLQAAINGTQEFLTKRLDAGNWTDVDTEKPHVELILADITGGGSSTPSLLVLPRRSSVLSKL
jgi:hypothetical protein